MAIYVFNLLVGWAPNGVDNAQGYRAKMLNHFVQPVNYIFTDLPRREDIAYYSKLGIGEEQVSKEDKEILQRYFLGAKTLSKKEQYDAGIYIRDVENMIAYSNENVKEPEIEEIVETTEKKRKNQLLLSKEEIEKMKHK